MSYDTWKWTHDCSDLLFHHPRKPTGKTLALFCACRLLYGILHWLNVNTTNFLRWTFKFWLHVSTRFQVKMLQQLQSDDHINKYVQKNKVGYTLLCQYSRTEKMQFLPSACYELTASTCFEHYFLISSRSCIHNNWYISCVLCRLAAIPIVVYAVPPDDEQIVLEACRGC
jgi:hypothetical protein